MVFDQGYESSALSERWRVEGLHIAVTYRIFLSCRHLPRTNLMGPLML